MEKGKYINVYDVLYNAEYTGKKYDEKWEYFDIICKSIPNFDLFDFYKKSEQFRNEGGLVLDITGITRISNEFPTLSSNGEEAYLKYKSEQLESVIFIDKKVTWENTKSIFPNFELEAIKKIFDYCKENGIIEYTTRDVFVYASDGIYAIIYENIKIPLGKKKNSEINSNIIINNGTIQNVNQAFNQNIKNDDDLFTLINNKLESIKFELANQYNDKINELENAIKKKDKKSVLTIISELSSVGSLIATALQAYFIK
jgi:hypothetical protein